jgi:hypothetical protein
LVSKKATQKFDMQKLDFKKLDDLEVKELYQIKISNSWVIMWTSVWSWENIRKNVKFLAQKI